MSNKKKPFDFSFLNFSSSKPILQELNDSELINYYDKITTGFTMRGAFNYAFFLMGCWFLYVWTPLFWWFIIPIVLAHLIMGSSYPTTQVYKAVKRELERRGIWEE